VQLLTRETAKLEPSSSGETWAWRPGGQDGAKTEELPPPSAISAASLPAAELDLHSHLEELLRPPLASTNGRPAGALPTASKGLRLDLRLVDGGEADLDVLDGVVTPTGMGLALPPPTAGGAAEAGSEDWFSTYHAGPVASIDAEPSEGPGTGVPCLSPLLTPSGAQLGAALVDAF